METNYIKRLQQQVADLDLDRQRADAELQELVIYLNSAKFHDHDYVNRKDVLERIERARFHLSYGGPVR